MTVVPSIRVRISYACFCLEPVFLPLQPNYKVPEAGQITVASFELTIVFKVVHPCLKAVCLEHCYSGFYLVDM